MDRWDKTFQVLEAEAQQTPMMSPEGIKRVKGEGIKAEKLVIPLIEIAPKYLYINKEGATMEWLRKWHHLDLQGKGQLIRDQEFIMRDVLDLQAYIFFFFFFWTGLCGPIACSLLGGGVPIPEQRL